MLLVKFYKREELDDSEVATLRDVLTSCDLHLSSVQFEYCYYIESSAQELGERDKAILYWLIEEPFVVERPGRSEDGCGLVTERSQISPPDTESGESCVQFEIGPRLNFCTPYSTNAVSICQSAGVSHVTRLECSRRYCIATSSPVTEEIKSRLIAALHDQMTEMEYRTTLTSFELAVKPSEVYQVDIMGDGKKALSKVNQDMGLAMDEWDLEYYTNLFLNKVKRNPTSVECFDLAQSNSEHCRHWFFGGRLVVDGEEKPHSLFKLVKSTQENTNPNNKIKFSDNSSCIEGYEVRTFRPSRAGESSEFISETVTQHIILTAETHNFPTAVAPFSGATTGTGGRIRDIQATGRGANVVAGTVGYCFGSLNIPGYELPWEDARSVYPSNFASPLNIIIEGSNGASDYGNKYGEPVICGFSRSFGLRVGDERREWIKPILFSGGIGSILDEHVDKKTPQVGDVVVKVGGPVYRIGVGGGAASSIQVQGDNAADLDLGAVQRGDAEMEQKMNRIIRACIESGKGDNPILSIHDQGAGGNGNVLKEICEPQGALIHCDAFHLGDPTINVLELWGAEYQESNALLAHPSQKALLEKIAGREKCQVSFVGDITGSGKIQLTPFGHSENENGEGKDETSSPVSKKAKTRLPVDLDLKYVLGDMPKKVFEMKRLAQVLKPLALPEGVTVRLALERVLRLPSVASKRYLTNKVDRSVTGLVAQQQCVGPLHTPLADVAVTALSYWDTKGAATAVGEQPIKMLVSPERGARMSVGESLTNLSLALITHLKDVKCSANWMWPAKLPGEGAIMFDACQAMCDVMKQLGIGIDGGKDSLSMAARVNNETVKSPGALVISTYAACKDIRKTVTPDLKCPDSKGELIYINLSKGGSCERLGGTALAQVYGQIGDESPDLDDPALFSRGFQAIQTLIEAGLLCAGHDVSDGGVITCLLEMAFAANCGFSVTFQCADSSDMNQLLAALFHEELGYVLEVRSSDIEKVETILRQLDVNHQLIGSSCARDKDCVVSVSSDAQVSERREILRDSVAELRDLWEETSYQLDLYQCNPTYVQQERDGMAKKTTPPYKLKFNTEETQTAPKAGIVSPKVAILREEGSNGDREMSAAFFTVGFEVHDVTMTDLISGAVTLDKFQGIAFVGGFSYADALGSAKGWAASVLYHDLVKAQFQAFYTRKDTFSLGVCNGCQLMTLLGWVGESKTTGSTDSDVCQVFMGRNGSGRYESRFSTVRIDESPSILLRGMSGSTLGIWVAHGEGKMNFRTADVYSGLSAGKLLPLKYVNDDNRPTAVYPFNPNDSVGGAAAICSPDGRHLAMMPHPERCFMTWQWPWMPQKWGDSVKTSPWLRMFRNAYDWCTQP